MVPPPNSPFIPRGRQITFSPEAPFSPAMKPQPLLHGTPTAPNSPPPSSPMPETLSVCCRALGHVPLTPCCRSCLDDDRVNRTGADSPMPLCMAPERLQLRMCPGPRCCFPVAIDH